MTKPNRKPQSPANICVFKETSDADRHRGISKEHVWPEWMAQLLPKPSSLNMHSHIFSKVDSSQEGRMKITRSASVHRGAMGTRKLRIVCASCNNGWMGRIEEQVKDVMTYLIRGEPMVISVDQQQALCRWIVLKTIIAEYTDLPMQAISIADRMYFKNAQQVPAGWKIWIGNFLGGEKAWQHRYSHTGASIRWRGESRLVELNSQSSTFIIGELFIYAVSLPGDVLDKWAPGSSLLQLWPSTGKDLTWPPYVPVGDAGAEEICYRLRDMAFHTSDAKVTYIELDALQQGFLDVIDANLKEASSVPDFGT